jgi:hypothetical protein
MKEKKPFTLKIPVAILLQEASNLHYCCQAHQKELKQHGLEWSIVEKMPAMINDSSQAEAQWQNFKAEQLKKAAASRAQFKELLAFRSDIVAKLRYAFRNQKDQLKALPHIFPDRSFATMSQSYTDLSVLIGRTWELVQKAGVTQDDVDRLNQLTGQVPQLISEYLIDQSELPTKKVERDLICKELFDAVQDVRSAGRVAFRKDLQTRELYGNHYRSRLYREGKTKKKNGSTKDN